MRYKYITIEGNIGAGKTTLTQLLQKEFQAKLVLEQFADNPFLPKFYKDRDKFSFPLELSFLADRYKQLKNMLSNRDLFSEYIFSDYLFIKSKLFAKVNLAEDEYKLYETLFEIIYPSLPQPDLVIFLDAPLKKLRHNISERNRDYEQNIEDDYLLNIQDAYLQLIKSEKYRTVIIDTSKTDFLNNRGQFERLLAYLENDFSFGSHHLDF